jgi:4-amino-4-deoxy-L-arabinose transferase-like glycosyltransferase
MTWSTRWHVAFGVIALTTFAAVIRFWAFGKVQPNPFYDAAVRSMSLSWRNLLFGALEPGGSVSIDKPPVDLWLQVASVKAFGFSSVALRLPEAIAGTLAIPLVYDVVRRGFGQTAGLTAGAALAVLPAAVLTARSDTMDTLMGTLLLAAAWTVIAAPASMRRHAVVAAGAITGLAFEVKLFEIVVALPALVAACVMAVGGSARELRPTLLRAAAAFLLVAALWPVAASLGPGPHPWPAGSTDGSIANVIVVYNGLDRLGYPAPGSFSASLPSPGPLRLLHRGPERYADLVGIELLPAMVLFGLAVWSIGRHRRVTGPVTRATRIETVLVGVWLATGYAFFSLQGRPRLRYLEAFTPSVAAALGIGLTATVGVVARARGWGRASTGLAVAVLAAGLLSFPLVTALHLARAGSEDSQTLGAFPSGQVRAVSRYLRAHQRGARYELASADTIIAGPIIARDGRPVLMLTSWLGRPFTSASTLERLVRRGEVRYLLLAETACASPTAPSCSPAAQWALGNSTDVSRDAGLGPSRVLLRLAA